MKLQVRGIHYWSNQRGGTVHIELPGYGQIDTTVRLPEALCQQLEQAILDQFTQSEAGKAFGNVISIHEANKGKLGHG